MHSIIQYRRLGLLSACAYISAAVRKYTLNKKYGLIKERFIAPPIFHRSIDALASDGGRSEGDAVMVHESIIRGYQVYKEVWKPKIELESTARAMHNQHATNSARMCLTASFKPGKYKYVCAYEKMCAYKKGALNNPSLRYKLIMYTRHYKSYLLTWSRSNYKTDNCAPSAIAIALTLGGVV